MSPKAINFNFDLQLFAINGGANGLPVAITNVTEQLNFLDTKYRKAIKPTRVLRVGAASQDATWAFQGQIGETKTFTRAALITPNVNPINPASNTGLDNGLSLDTRSFEQWQAQLFEWAGGLNINILGNETILADLYLDDVEKLGQKAGDSLELVCALRAFTAYDQGDTFMTVATTAANASLVVDNINGFTTQFTTTNAPSYGLPQPVSAGNKLAVMVIAPNGTIIGAANVTAAVPAGNSYMISGPLTCGAAGTLTLDATVPAAPIGSRVVAMDASNPSVSSFNATYKDGSYVVRPLQAGTMVPTAYQMLATNTLAPSVQFPLAAALLRRRAIPKLPNGLYGVAVDSTLLSYLYQDPGFQIATQGTWDRSPVFTNGIIAKGWGLEFVEDTQLPVYLAPAGGFNLRHAFCFGADVLAEHPFLPAVKAQSRAAGIGDMFDFRWVDRIEFITQAALDRLAEVIKLSYKYVGDFQPPTDKGSNPNNVLTSDYGRYKRGVIVQAASSV